MYDYLIKVARDDGVIQAMNIINYWLDVMVQMGEKATEEERVGIQVLYDPIHRALLDIISGRF